MPPFDNNFWKDWLDEQPQIGYAAHLQDQGFGRNKTQALRRMFGDIQFNFFGQLGNQVRQGGSPTLRWNDFLETFDFDKYYRSLSPSQQGRHRGAFAPGLRRITGY